MQCLGCIPDEINMFDVHADHAYLRPQTTIVDALANYRKINLSPLLGCLFRHWNNMNV